MASGQARVAGKICSITKFILLKNTIKHPQRKKEEKAKKKKKDARKPVRRSHSQESQSSLHEQSQVAEIYPS
jgi:hypothetical protein